VADRREEEFTEFVVARRKHLRRFAYLLCQDWHGAEDLTQIALTKLYVAWPRIRRAGTEDGYARQTVLRTFLDERRRPWRRESATAELPDREGRHGLSYEDLDQLREAVRSLPGRQRAAVVLRHWWGLSLDETAADLGISVGTVKSQVARAVDRLRHSLTDDARTDTTP
jgi:RNA polymerase sigma-70 factor (sigma-E family)